MSKTLNLAVTLAAICFLVGCAEQQPAIEKPLAAVEAANSHLGRMPNVRTTAYTRKEEGGIRNALGTYLSGRHVMSAAADWSRFPLGTRFRICSTREEFIIDDYGTALVGTNTIDLYKPTKLEMKRWGVRVVDIDVLQWGSEQKSADVLGPRAKHPQVKSMLTALHTKTPSTTVAVAPPPKQPTKPEKKLASNKTKASAKADKKVASSKTKLSAKSEKKVASNKTKSAGKSEKELASSEAKSSPKSDKKVASSKSKSSSKSAKKVASSANRSSAKSPSKQVSSKNSAGVD
jgi:3D (Asp-Asp-Asp) domain-containing protein